MNRSLPSRATISSLGTAQEITLQELRIESFHPTDAETERLFRAVAAGAEPQPGVVSPS